MEIIVSKIIFFLGLNEKRTVSVLIPVQSICQVSKFFLFSHFLSWHINLRGWFIAKIIPVEEQ